MNSVSTALETSLVMSRQMLDMARQGLWDDVIACEAERSALLQAFFQNPPTQAKDSIVEKLRELVAMDEEIMALGEIRRNELGDELHKMEHSKKAIKAYTL